MGLLDRFRRRPTDDPGGAGSAGGAVHRSHTPKELSNLLAAAVGDGGDERLAAWAATGREGLLFLREVLAGTRSAPWNGVDSRTMVDNVPAAAAAIARANPGDFLEVFEDPRWEGGSAITAGLGEIDDERATERLIRVAASLNETRQMEAAIALRGHASAASSRTLCQLLGSRDMLIRYHAVRSLAAVGDVAALPALARLAERSPAEREVAQAVAAVIRGRVERGEAPRGGPPVMDWLPSERESYSVTYAGESGEAELEIQGDRLVAIRGRSRSEVLGTAFHIGTVSGFRPDVPLTLLLDGRPADGKLADTALTRLREAAKAHGVRVDWPA